MIFKTILIISLFVVICCLQEIINKLQNIFEKTQDIERNIRTMNDKPNKKKENQFKTNCCICGKELETTMIEDENDYYCFECLLKMFEKGNTNYWRNM